MNGRASTAGTSSGGVDATLAAIATLTAAWPISTLLAEPTWLRGTILLLGVVVLSGVGARALALRGWQVLLVQLVCSVLAAGAAYGRGHLWHGLPTFDTLGFAGGLIREAVVSAQRYAAPAPTTPGLIFVVGCSLGLVALAVDFLAVTCHSPSLAGLPLLTVFLAGVANRGSTLPAVFFLAAAGMWLILVARQEGGILRRWGTTVSVPHTQIRQSLESQGAYAHATMARMLGAVALVVAVAVPVGLPRPLPTFLGQGLGRSSSANGNGAQGVEFAQSIDLAADLKNPSMVPVLQYTTADTSPPPLRVAVGSYYRPDPGIWLPGGRPWHSSPGRSDLSTNPRVPETAGLSPDIPKRNFVMQVRRNVLQDPYLASPYPLIGADLGGVEWGADYQTQSIKVARTPDSYTVSYWHLQPTATMLSSAPSLSDNERDFDRDFDLDLLLDGPYVQGVKALTDRLTADQPSAYDKAMAIQQYLRADGGFTYSLTLAPPVKDRSGRNAYDSLTNFLVTKQGYCVQFATAMVMMSRAAGIPARLSLGFMPGTESKGVWTVVASDAHAWPELYLGSIGWTRFEPTPSRATPPAYAVPASSPGNVVPLPRPVPTRVTAPGDKASAGTTSAKSTGAHPVGLSPGSVLGWLTHGWGPVLLGSLTGLLGVLVVPAAARWRRRRSLAAARTSAERIEVQWELLTSSLGDLGIIPAPSRTPRQLHAYYDREALLEEADSQALGRVTQTLERSRYEESAPTSEGLSEDVRQVFRAAAANRAGRDRLRAALWPSSGVSQLQSARAYLADFSRRIFTPLRQVSDVLHRWSSRREVRRNHPTAPR